MVGVEGEHSKPLVPTEEGTERGLFCMSTERKWLLTPKRRVKSLCSQMRGTVNQGPRWQQKSKDHTCVCKLTRPCSLRTHPFPWSPLHHLVNTLCMRPGTRCQVFLKKHNTSLTHHPNI